LSNLCEQSGQLPYLPGQEDKLRHGVPVNKHAVAAAVGRCSCGCE
jgi:hypothetical protein